MGMPSRNPNFNQSPRSSKSFIPYLAVLTFAAIFVFKVDILISQTIYAARRNVEGKPRNIVVEQKVLDTQASTLNGTFRRHFIVTWGEEKVNFLNDGELLTLALDKSSGSGFQSRKEYLFCKIDMRIKLVPGNSAGTVTTYYLSSVGSAHDEIDFEFLGNSSGNPYTLHTNVFSQGKGEREMQFFLWFDPTTDFHTYTILWNPKNILFYVDGTPIREFKNAESIGVPFPKDQAMRLYSSIWNADDWATQGGRVKTNWRLAPFVAAYKNFSAKACIWSRFTYTSSCSGSSIISSSGGGSGDSSMVWFHQELDNRSRMKMKLLQRKYMTYNYCKDRWRFPKGPAPECKLL